MRSYKLTSSRSRSESWKETEELCEGFNFGAFLEECMIRTTKIKKYTLRGFKILRMTASQSCWTEIIIVEENNKSGVVRKMLYFSAFLRNATKTSTRVFHLHGTSSPVTHTLFIVHTFWL